MIRSTALVCALTLSAGCELGWDDVPGAHLRVTSLDPVMSDGGWAIYVRRAVDAWNAGMVGAGCPAPFDPEFVAVGAHEVRLVPVYMWEHDPTWSGVTYADSDFSPAGGIDVRSDYGAEHGWIATLLHELGHAVGLGHADPELGPSVMLSVDLLELAPRDVAAAACEMGCGPCDGPDPYDD